MALVIDTEPSEEPISVAEAKEHANVGITADDSLIGDYITAARVYCEGIAGRQFVTATWKLVLDRFPPGQIVVPRPPLSSVTSITYTDENGNAQTWSSALYQKDTNSEPGRIAPIETETFPNTQSGTYGTVVVTFVAGYGAAAAVAPRYRLAIRMLVAQWYNFREPIVTGTTVANVPASVKALLMQGRIWRF